MSEANGNARVYHSLEDAVLEGGVSTLVLAMDKFRDQINTPGAGGNTPLHHAVARGEPELVEILLREGAAPSLSARNARYETPLAMARCYATVDPSAPNKASVERVVELLEAAERENKKPKPTEALEGRFAVAGDGGRGV